jgi:hypothetical protein
MTDEKEPITAEWLASAGAEQVGSYWRVAGVPLNLRPCVFGPGWMLIVGGRVLDWSATTRGQIDRLRRALKGEV